MRQLVDITKSAPAPHSRVTEHATGIEFDQSIAIFSYYILSLIQ